MLAAQNINSFSELAFLSGTRPPSDEEFKALSDSVLGGGASAGQIGLLRRLHFKATTLVLSHLKTAVTSETSEDIGKHPFAEKQMLAGPSNLTIEIRKANLRGVAVGKSVGRAKGPITVWDLTVEEEAAFFQNLSGKKQAIIGNALCTTLRNTFRSKKKTLGPSKFGQVGKRWNHTNAGFAI